MFRSEVLLIRSVDEANKAGLITAMLQNQDGNFLLPRQRRARVRSASTAALMLFICLCGDGVGQELAKIRVELESDLEE